MIIRIKYSTAPPILFGHEVLHKSIRTTMMTTMQVKAPTNSTVANNNDTKQEEGEGGYTKQSSYTQAATCGKQNIVKLSSSC